MDAWYPSHQVIQRTGSLAIWLESVASVTIIQIGSLYLWVRMGNVQLSSDFLAFHMQSSGEEPTKMSINLPLWPCFAFPLTERPKRSHPPGIPIPIPASSARKPEKQVNRSGMRLSPSITTSRYSSPTSKRGDLELSNFI